MKTLNLIQGSPEWLEHRRSHFNASDVPAMLGISPYKTRTQLLNEMATGITAEVDEGTQRRFDDGHRFEALARPLAEEIIGEPLSPVTGESGKLSASFDGLTFMEDIAFEHKSMNGDLRGVAGPATIPEHYRAQMEQQLLVSGAGKCLFMGTKWDSDDNLLEKVSVWYEPDPAMRERIVMGWAQFEKDLANYKPHEIAEKPLADSIMQFPALSIQLRGEVTTSNLPAFKAAAEQFISSIKTDLATDEDFANAEATVKFCDKAEKDLEVAKKAALGQTASIDELMRTIDYIKDELRSKRLSLERLVKDKKESIKFKILQDAKHAFMNHINELYQETKPIELNVTQPDFAGVMKNKRTLESLHDAVDTELATAKINADAVAKDVRGKIAWFNEAADAHAFLFHDLQQIIYKPFDDFKLLVNTRIEQHEQAAKVKSELERAAVAEQPKESPVALVETAQPAPVIDKQAVVIEHEAEIREFLKSRNFPAKEENKYRAVIIEFIKWRASRSMQKAA